jgi:hypothetical protein
MAYEKQVDELVGRHVCQFQLELSLARVMGQLDPNKRKVPAMPYGYPIAVYRPKHICRLPQVRAFVARSGGTQSNGVPRVLRTEFVGQYILGVYNPLHCGCR